MSMFDYMKTPDSTYRPYTPPQPVRRNRRPRFGKLRLLFEIILILIIFILVANDGDGAGSAAAPAADSATATAEPRPTGPAAAPVFPGEMRGDVVGQPGDPLNLDEITVTASELLAGKMNYGEQASLCATVTLANKSDIVIDFDDFDFNLQSPAGLIMYPVRYGSDNQLTVGGKIAPSGSATGDVCFANNDTDAGLYVLLYTPGVYPPEYLPPRGRGAWLHYR